MVLNSAKFDRGKNIFQYHPFKLNKESNIAPTTFKITFIQNGIKFIYSISYDLSRIIEESLYYYKTNRLSTIFERYSDQPEELEEKTFVNVQEYYYFFPPQFRSNFKAIAKNTNCNTLFLSKTRTENVSITDDVFNWFDHLKILHDFGTDIEDMKETSESLLNDPILHQLIFKMLLSTDSSIKDIQIPQEEYHIVNFEKIINSDRKKPLKSVINDELFLEPKIIRNNIAFDLMEEESEGTKKIFALIGPILKILKEGCVLFYDELDVKIHPNLALFLIKLFNNEKNQSAQLIFTTHNTFFLNNDIFRRDQIWFTGKKS